MIDPLSVVIQYLKSAGLSTRQIAEKERYGDAWQPGSASLVVRLDGGTPDPYLPIQELRFEVRCYGADSPEAIGLYGEIVELTRVTDRMAVTIGSQIGLLYWIMLDAAPTSSYDPDLNQDFVLVFLRAKIAEQNLGD